LLRRSTSRRSGFGRGAGDRITGCSRPSTDHASAPLLGVLHRSGSLQLAGNGARPELPFFLRAAPGLRAQISMGDLAGGADSGLLPAADSDSMVRPLPAADVSRPLYRHCLCPNRAFEVASLEGTPDDVPHTTGYRPRRGTSAAHADRHLAP